MDRNSAVLREMLEEIDFLQQDTKGVTREKFMANERLRRSVSMTLINIGELVRHLTYRLTIYLDCVMSRHTDTRR